MLLLLILLLICFGEFFGCCRFVVVAYMTKSHSLHGSDFDRSILKIGSTRDLAIFSFGPRRRRCLADFHRTQLVLGNRRNKLLFQLLGTGISEIFIVMN